MEDYRESNGVAEFDNETCRSSGIFDYMRGDLAAAGRLAVETYRLLFH